MVTIGGNRFHPLWLRDNCPCQECRHESGQRLLDTRTLPDDLDVVDVVENGSLEISFSDGHVGRFDPAWLRSQYGDDQSRSRTFWDAGIQPRAALAEDAA